jgi:transposase InsO family protein
MRRKTVVKKTAICNRGSRSKVSPNHRVFQGLEDRKPVPLSCPHRTSDAIVDRVLELRKKHPYDGPKKVRAMLLAAAPAEDIPAASTIGDILKRHGLIRPRRMRLRVPINTSPLEHAIDPNDVWCTDFKGHFPLGDGQRCYPLTITDAASRFLIKCEGLAQPRTKPVEEQFELAFREFGLPRAIRSDNGPPFASVAPGGLSALSAWWIRFGILPDRIEPGKPQQNGRHERFHRTLKEQTAQPPMANMPDQQRSFDLFRADYNNRRPHEALGQTPPATHYEPSRRAMPAQPRDPEYPSSFVVRRVISNGAFTWKQTHIFVAKFLDRQPVGLEQASDDEWDVFYGPVLLGHLLQRSGEWRLERAG